MNHPFTLWTVPVLMQDRFTLPGCAHTSRCWLPLTEPRRYLCASNRRLAVWTLNHALSPSPCDLQFCGLLPAKSTHLPPVLSQLWKAYGLPAEKAWKRGDLALDSLTPGPLQRIETCGNCAGRGVVCPQCVPVGFDAFDPACERCHGAGERCDACDGLGNDVTDFSETLFSLDAGEVHFSRAIMASLLAAFGPAEWQILTARSAASRHPERFAVTAIALRWPQASAVLAAMTRRNEPSALEMQEWRATQPTA